jgi:hypothetical protein
MLIGREAETKKLKDAYMSASPDICCRIWSAACREDIFDS